MLFTCKRSAVTNCFIIILIIVAPSISQFCNIFAHPIERCLLITGEFSGDNLAQWYITQVKQNKKQLWYGICGNTLSEHVQILSDFDPLRQGMSLIEGFRSLLSNLQTKLDLYKKIPSLITELEITHVILIDFPFINLPLARELKKQFPWITITYIAPPELWFWGTWNIQSLLRCYCNHIIVLYPHEVQWYRLQGLSVEWHGYPYYQDFKNYIDRPIKKENLIVFLPGSRLQEVKTMMPLITPALLQLINTFPELSLAILQASSIDAQIIHHFLKEYNVENRVSIIKENHKNYIARACAAIAKPGTNTLELALLSTPTVVTLKMSFIRYMLFKTFINPLYVSLPNLLTNQEIFIELIQNECTPERIFKEISLLYLSYKTNGNLYKNKIKSLERFQHSFSTQWNTHANNTSSTIACS